MLDQGIHAKKERFERSQGSNGQAEGLIVDSALSRQSFRHKTPCTHPILEAVCDIILDLRKTLIWTTRPSDLAHGGACC